MARRPALASIYPRIDSDNEGLFSLPLHSLHAHAMILLCLTTS